MLGGLYYTGDRHWGRILLTNGEKMGNVVRTLFGVVWVAAMGLGIEAAHAGGFGVREQSAYFMGSAFAGSAAGGDISSMFWNSAATAAQAGCNSSENLTVIAPRLDETAQGGAFVTGAGPGVPGLSPTSTDVGRTAYVASSFSTCQLTDKLFVGLGSNAPFGLMTKPDNTGWAGSPFAVTTKVFSFDLNPTLAYKLTPDLTIGVGLQIEYFSITLNHGPFNTLGPLPLSGARSYDANDWGLGATAGVLWQPSRSTSIGLGYRSAVGENVRGQYATTPSLSSGGLAISTNAAGSVTLPDEVTLSARQYVTPQLALLGTVEWQNWSRLQNVTASSAGCPAGTCETLNLNYRDGWYYAIGAEFAVSPSLMLRTGIAYETSPIQDSTRDILLPDANRIDLSAGASYKISSQVTMDVGYSHLFVEDGTFCIANPAANGGSYHCNAATPAVAVLLNGKTNVSADLVALGLKYKW
jgi:long-chain fatty acid transport protein